MHFFWMFLSCLNELIEILPTENRKEKKQLMLSEAEESEIDLV